jgi:uncharacterized protein YegP (UPF0339 family)
MIKAQMYPSGDQWYWRIKSHNGKTLADGAEGYASKGNCKRALDKFFQNIVNLVSTKGQTLHQMENNIELEITVEVLDNKGRVVQEY